MTCGVKTGWTRVQDGDELPSQRLLDRHEGHSSVNLGGSSEAVYLAVGPCFDGAGDPVTDPNTAESSFISRGLRVYSPASSAPVVASVTPGEGSVAGGSEVLVTGTRLTGTTGVTVGGSAATDVNVTSANHLRATVPAGSAGAADVVVTSTMGSSTLSGGYVYRDVVPTGLVVDVEAGAGATGDLNGILEPGEVVTVAPTWSNLTGSPLDLTSHAGGFIGPGTATYATVDAGAGYGTITSGGSAGCSAATGDCYVLGVSAPANRPAVHWDTRFVEVLPSGQTKTWTVHVGASFWDVPPTRWEYPDVETIFHLGLSAGCGGNSFCPDVEVNREQMAVQILRAVGVTDQPAWQDIFSDMPDCSPDPTVFCWSRWAEEFYRRGISAGCYYNPSTGERRFCPLNTLPRQQMAVQILRALGVTTQPAWEDIFSDMPDCDPDLQVFCWSRWAEEFFRLHVTEGCYHNQETGERRFCPQGAVPRSHMAVFLVRAFDLKLYGP